MTICADLAYIRGCGFTGVLGFAPLWTAGMFAPEREASCSSRIGFHSLGCLARRLAATSSHHTECGNSSAPRLSDRLDLT